MPAYSFQKRFVPKILDGSKEHTIRGWRKYPAKPGDLLSLYYGMRTKQCELLLRRKCTAARPIVIASTGLPFGDPGQSLRMPHIEIDGTTLIRDEMEALARRDGFDSLRDMANFWDLSTAFSGQIIHWRFAEVRA